MITMAVFILILLLEKSIVSQHNAHISACLNRFVRALFI